MKKTANLQDIFLTKARKQGVPLTVFPVSYTHLTLPTNSLV